MVDFGGVHQDRPVRHQPFGLYSTDGSTIAVTGLRVEGDAADYTAHGMPCSAGPFPGTEGCGVAVTFAPTTTGPRRARLVVTYDGGELTVPLTGAGLGPAGDPVPPSGGDERGVGRTTWMTPPGDPDGYETATGVSDGGRFVSFESPAPGRDPAVADDPEAWSDMFVRDTETGVTTNVSRTPDGRSGTGYESVLSPDGRFVAFTSPASDLDPRTAHPDGAPDVFLHDNQTGVTRTVSRTPGGDAAGTSGQPRFSDDGRYVFFTSRIQLTLFRYDRLADRVESIAALSGDGQWSASGDGRHVALASAVPAAELGAGAADAESTGDVFVRDTATNTTRLVSHALDDPGRASSGADPAISADGTTVTFTTPNARAYGDERGAEGPSPHPAVLVWHGATGAFEIITRTAAGRGIAHQRSSAPVVSPDGSIVAFLSEAENLVTGISDPNQGDRPGSGYYGGTVTAFGSATDHEQGSMTGPAVDIEALPGGRYLTVDEQGRVQSSRPTFPYAGLGPPALPPGERVTSLSVHPEGGGYWLFTSTGRVLPYGYANHFGDMTGIRLNGPVLDSVATPTGRGYLMVAADGGIFNFSDRPFSGSLGATGSASPIVAVAASGRPGR